MKAGEKATITATVNAYGSDNYYADFYYATDMPVWTFIDTVQAASSGVQNFLSVDYELPVASIHIVRVNFRRDGVARYEADALIRVICHVCLHSFIIPFSVLALLEIMMITMTWYLP